MKVKRKLLTMFMIITLLLCACSQQKKVTNDNYGTTSQSNTQMTREIFGADVKREDALKSCIEKKDSQIEVKNLKVCSTRPVDKGTLAMFLFENKTVMYEGLAMIADSSNDGSKTIISIDYTPVDLTVAFTVHELSGDISRDENGKKTYLFIGGVINKKDITVLNIEFNNGLLAKVNLDSTTNTYSYSRDSIVGIKSITALDKDGKAVSKYPK